MKISPVPGISIEVTSSIDSGEEDEHRFRVVEILDLVTMMGRFYQAGRKRHQILKLYLKTHPGLRFAVPNAQNSDQDDWYTDIKLNLQKAWDDLYSEKPTNASRKVGFNVKSPARNGQCEWKNRKILRREISFCNFNTMKVVQGHRNLSHQGCISGLWW